MAFQNKCASIFQYGSHYPLIRLSGHTLCIELLIKKYLSSIKTDVRYSALLLFIYDLLHADGGIQEMSLQHLLNGLQTRLSDIGQEIANYVHEQLGRLLREDNTDLLDFFQNELSSFIVAEDQLLEERGVDQEEKRGASLSKQSVLGVFHRKVMACYNHASFATLNKLRSDIRRYHDGDDGGTVGHPQEHSQRLKCPYELDDQLYELSRQQSLRTMPTHQHDGGGGAIATNHSVLRILSDAFPELPSTHYLNCIRNMQNGEYLASLSYLHKYFDFVGSPFKMNWNSIINNKQSKINQKQYQSLLHKKRKKMQYALLCRAMFFAYFGHYNLAIKQITEALQRAQNIADRTCVSSALYLLVELLSDQSGNANLIKQIYENCIQNTESTSSVHVGSLIGLSKWHLYHICVYRTKSRPWYLWQYLFFANNMIVHSRGSSGSNNNSNLSAYFADIHALKGNAWNLYGNETLSSLSYQIVLLNHRASVTDNLLSTTVANYLQSHCVHHESVQLLQQMSDDSPQHARNLVLNQTSLILLLEHSVRCGHLELANIYQTRLAELIPSSKHNFLLYLRMMFLHCQIRFEHAQFMEASRILNNLIAICNQRSLHCITVPYYLYLSKIHLQCHGEISQVMSYVLKAWSLCKSYHFYHWLPECVLVLSELHLQLDNTRKAFHLIQQHMPMIMRKRNHFICDAYVILAKCCTHRQQYISAIQYFHCARIWCVKLMATDSAFKQSCKAKETLQEIYYFLARLYEDIGDRTNREKSAQKLMALLDAK